MAECRRIDPNHVGPHCGCAGDACALDAPRPTSGPRKNAAIYEGKVLLRETPGIYHRFAPVGGLVCGTTTAHPLRESDGQFDWQPCSVCFPAEDWKYERTHSEVL